MTGVSSGKIMPFPSSGKEQSPKKSDGEDKGLLLFLKKSLLTVLLSFCTTLRLTKAIRHLFTLA